MRYDQVFRPFLGILQARDFIKSNLPIFLILIKTQEKSQIFFSISATKEDLINSNQFSILGVTILPTSDLFLAHPGEKVIFKSLELKKGFAKDRSYSESQMNP